MNYTVCFLFTDNGEKVLLQKKDKTQYAGRLNGVGGKIEPGETPLEGARREIMEETGASIQDLIWLGTLIFPKDCALPADQENVDCELNFFAGTVEDTKMVSQQPGETEPLLWLLTRQVIGGHADTAGDGDVEYFVDKGYRAITARASVPATGKKLAPDAGKWYWKAVDNLIKEAKFLEPTPYTHSSTIFAMKEAAAVIRDLASGQFDSSQVGRYKGIANSLAREAKTFERDVIKSCVERYAFSRSVDAMEEAVAAIRELIKFNR